MAVLVLDKKKRPLMPCSEKRARLLLDRGQAIRDALAQRCGFRRRRRAKLRYRPARFMNRTN